MGARKWSGVSTASNALSMAAINFASIDEALHYFGDQTDVVDIGKLAIVTTILEAENNSVLAIDRDTGRPVIEKMCGTWYESLFSTAISGLKKQEISQIFDNVCFVNFNYDRTLECYLYNALNETADVGHEVAAGIVAKLRVLTPYGSLGEIDWHVSGVHLGGSLNSTQSLFAMEKGIQTFTEAKHESIQTQVCQALDQSELVIILGFGNHGQNMALLSMTNAQTRMGRDRFVFATAKEIHKENMPSLMQRLSREFLTDRVKLLDMTASDLLRELRPSIVSAAT
jgi:hypothetical protein